MGLLLTEQVKERRSNSSKEPPLVAEKKPASFDATGTAGVKGATTTLLDFVNPCICCRLLAHFETGVRQAAELK